MADVHEVPRPRIATGHLAQRIGQPVCFVGRVEKIHPTGKLLVLSDGEGKHATVELSEPLDEEISGVLEVVGRVTNQATIMCMSYVQFREDKSPFDLELYNEALKIIHEFPEYFPFGTGRNN
ncbi:replication protein A 14 kDa subunit [Strix aluco]|uniref:Replication protein A3 n=1 Tax=Strix occidentalis caurina TaxID=311401 RepID=A0A8D0FJ07_STROC